MAANAMSLAQFAASLRAPKIIGMCGSNRPGSLNRKLLACAASELTKQGAEVEVVDLSALQLPLYDSALDDPEGGSFPANAALLKEKLVACDGILITCPEFNGNITPLMCNAITWATRGAGGMYDGFKGKCCMVMATSPGALGGLRMMRSFQEMLQDMGCLIVPSHCSLGKGFTLFDDEGNIANERAKGKVESACAQMVHFARFEANRDKDSMIVNAIRSQQVAGEYGNLGLD